MNVDATPLPPMWPSAARTMNAADALSADAAALWQDARMHGDRPSDVGDGVRCAALAAVLDAIVSLWPGEAAHGG